ncbi:hypothetical protein [Streptomyces sp. CB02261]|uniref:hypothetical protein n=1 Tax=Streptomyces sp. CB02261 TaxID=1703940 RepID=UPI001160FBA5|nr:hypothetical protein [Streptomyces sp. CB02261]
MDVPIALEQSIAALRQHARLMSEPGSVGEAGIDAFETLRSAAISYGRAVRDTTGWDSPFDELEEVEGLGVADEAEDPTGSDRSSDSSRSVESRPDTCFRHGIRAVILGSWIRSWTTIQRW